MVPRTAIGAARPIGTTLFIIQGEKIFSASTLCPTDCFPRVPFIERPRSSILAVRLQFRLTDRPRELYGRLNGRQRLRVYSRLVYCTHTTPPTFPKSCTTRIRRECEMCSDRESLFLYPQS